MANNSLTFKIANGLLMSSATVLASIAGFGLISSMMIHVQSSGVDEEVHMKMDSVCVDRFSEERQNIWNKSSLSRQVSTLIAHKKWKKNGMWEECLRENERV